MSEEREISLLEILKTKLNQELGGLVMLNMYTKIKLDSVT